MQVTKDSQLLLSIFGEGYPITQSELTNVCQRFLMGERKIAPRTTQDTIDHILSLLRGQRISETIWEREILPFWSGPEPDYINYVTPYQRLAEILEIQLSEEQISQIQRIDRHIAADLLSMLSYLHEEHNNPREVPHHPPFFRNHTSITLDKGFPWNKLVAWIKKRIHEIVISLTFDR